MGLPMKFPKYSCSVCRKPSSRKWNCHAGIGNCVRPDLWTNFLSSNESNDRKPFDYYHVFAKAFLKKLAKMGVSTIQPTQSRISFPFSSMSYMRYPYLGTYNADPAANLQIFGFRGYVCKKCLTSETHYVAFPVKEDGCIQGGHYCVPTNAAAPSGSVDRSRVFRSLQDKLPMLIKQQVNSMNGNNSHLIALRLSNPQKKTIELPNPVDPSKAKIVFPYSEQTHLYLESAKEREYPKENKNKREYLRRAITAGTTPLSDEELLNFLEVMRNATFGVITVHNNTSEDNSSHDSLSYFVYIKSCS
jgi:hypothetical protein